MSEGTHQTEALPGATFPQGVDIRWETENRAIWNDQKREREERELVYEVSWISELGVWRRFLRSQRRVGSLQ